jgi:penicillin-binding protein 1A
MGIFRKEAGEPGRPAAEPVLPMPPPQAGDARPPFPFVFFRAGPPPGPPPPQQPPPAEPPKKRRIPWKTLFMVPAAAAAAGLVALGIMLVHYTMVFPDPLALRHKERAPVIRILARDGAVLAERGAAHDYMPVDMLPKHVTDAVVATEDRRFYEHWGVDPYGMIRAVFANLRAGRFAQGGSTLTQQLAKNLFLSPDRTLGRKLEELMLAIWLEVRLSKRDILELYLNQVYFGGGAYGIEAAAHRYFDKSARELNIAEAALIAGLLKAPSKYSPASSPGAARARGRSVVKKMREAGVIGAEDERRAERSRIVFAEAKGNREATGVEYAVDFVLERMPSLIAADHAEIVVETTIDAQLQRRVQQIVQGHLKAQGESLNAGQAAVVVLDTDGGIRALIGGRSYAESQFNRAVKARRQPGSAMKPFVYLTALENGYTPETTAYDLPLSVESWTPRNDNGQYLGAVSLRQALAQSINTVAVRLLLDVGARRVVATAKRLGIKSDLREGASLALGSSELTLLELTGAYGVLGNGGLAIEPHAIRRVRLSSGRVLFARDAQRTQQIVAPAYVGALNEMLSNAVANGTGKRAAIPPQVAAGKTGTTSDFRDAWFVGYTAHLTGGVWIGNDNGHAMVKSMGGNLPATIWHDIMLAAHEGRAPLALPGTSRSTPLRSSLPMQQVVPSLKPICCATQPAKELQLVWPGCPAGVTSQFFFNDAVVRPPVMPGNVGSLELSPCTGMALVSSATMAARSSAALEA